jgi:alpha-beta hydrolase superfamily lysophospholipase
MILVSKTYWGSMPFWFRRAPASAKVESLAIRTHDFRVLRALYWTSEAAPRPRVVVVVMHPRVDFTQHYSIPRLLAAGFGVLAASTRHGNNELFADHESMVLDVDACVRFVRERREAQKVVLLGNCGGGSLFAYYQAQARLPQAERIVKSPGGADTHFDSAPMMPADAMVYLAAHRGQGKVLLDSIDPSARDEGDALACDPSLDLYAPENGFREPPAWSAYAPDFIARYRAAQAERVARIDAVARASIAEHAKAAAAGDQRRAAIEPLMVVHRTMANPSFVDRALDPSDREYGSLLSERPDLMNYAALGLARVSTPSAWLSTWSGHASNADLVANVARIDEPSLFVFAGADREILPKTDVAPIVAAARSRDKRVVTIDGARHYFEPEPGARDAPDVERAMDVVVPWIAERTS